jgi:UDP-N-acetyl-2-amino-2-deoxyglucuronate dehydrogenase
MQLKPAGLKLGIVGCGDIAAYTAFFARLNPGISLAACCDVDGRRAGRFAKRYGIRQVFTDYARLLDEAGLDAVYLAVPHHLHGGMIQAALRVGKSVFTEKPVTRTLAEGLEVVRLAEASGLPVAVNYQYRYDTGCYALARAVQAGEIGDVRYVRINIPWQRGGSYFSGAAWHASLAQAGGGTLLTQGSHFLDVALWACGLPVTRVHGVTARRVFSDVEVEDLAMGILELENGALMEICSSMVAAAEQAVRIEIYGSKATAVYTNQPFPRTSFTRRGVNYERPPVWGVHALMRSIEAFRRWAAGGPPHLVTARDALPVLSAVEALYRSAF